VQFLVEHGAGLTAQDKDGWAPLRLASEHGHVEIIAHLLSEHSQSEQNM